MEQTVSELIKELTESLNHYRDAYYNRSTSLITDEEYDKLFDKLKQLEEESGIIMSNSPTQNVGFEVLSELHKTIHSHPMLSLAKTKSQDDLKAFAGEKDCMLSLKLDGLTVLLTYENGKLTKAETRGDGITGEDITHNAKVFENIPLTIEEMEQVEIEGEAIITYDDFAEINLDIPEDERYRNPRNLVSGSVRQLDSGIAKNRHIKFIAWKVPTYNKSNSYFDSLQYAHQLGFTSVPIYRYNSSKDADDIDGLIHDLKWYAAELLYPIDGLVMTYDDLEYGKSLGNTGHHPKHSIAYKFYDESVETSMQDVEWTLGKSGQITPTAIFTPVEIDGTTVERASLHNAGIFEELNLYRGDTVTVYKANMIIPQIRANLDRETQYKSNIMKFIMPKTCPVCGAKTMIKQDGIAKILYCSNPYCSGKKLNQFIHFVSKDAMNIDGLSEATLEKFVNKGWIKNFTDIYKLKRYSFEMEQLEGFGHKSVYSLLTAIENSRKVTLDKFINALSIPNVGKETAKLIAKECNYLIGNFIDRLEYDSDWSTIDSIGSVVNTNIADWYNYHWDLFQDLIAELDFVVPENNNNKLLNGKTFVITGSLNQFVNRDEAKNLIESLGGKVSGSVSNKTNYLVNNDINSMSGKNKKAKELGIPIISEDELLKMIEK